ncbi:hypothetical protein K461DRAFT_218985 [Myriangium duriaei CBS 260.36]|uniref:LYC1 C-terminal domain-containing protein n=1 Tax=Myriangium duriaei CBS 260.36 TaxID=1168546 RepID=A0A9P4JEA0_9PEZI|nr:hypothetical protein K461DRAFT_218985 [Myriangium duriaei CBS 260.36]
MADTYPYLATQTPEEAQEAIAWRAESMRGPLNPEVYLRREDLLAEQQLTRRGGLLGWILAVDRADGSREQLCACETLRKRALVATANSDHVDQVICYGVASVYCPPANRAKGYPSAMLAQLAKWMEADGKAAFSVLYSGIGRKFYGRLGWRPFESAHVTLKPTHENVPDGVRLLKKEDMEALCKSDEQIIRRRLLSFAHQGKSAVAIVPDVDTILWHQAREAFMSNEYYGRTPETCGAFTKTPSGTDIWCLWTRWWYKPPGRNTLHILRLVVDDGDYDGSAATFQDTAVNPEISAAIARLLRVARAEASTWEMVDVQLWNPSSATMAAVKQLEPDSMITYRESSIPSLRWCNRMLSEIADSLVWTCNEKYAWC